MGLLDGKRALIFGVANDHSIAWGIAQALHREGAVLGSVGGTAAGAAGPAPGGVAGSTFIEPCDVQDDAQISRVFERGRAYGREGSLDVLVHALAFARREELDGRFVDTSRDGFSIALDIWRIR